MAKILVTGGLGYIGSHTCVELINGGHQVVIVDNLSNSSVEVLEGITAITHKKPIFIEGDLRQKHFVNQLFESHPDVAGLIHFAAFKAVGESVEKPLDYYENNITTLVYLLQAMHQRKLSNFIFSSSCTVYGQADELPVAENSPVKQAESPYGNTKQIGEEIIREAVAAHDLKAIALRYFNPIGAHPSAHLGELPMGVPQNLVPFVTQTGAGLREQLSVFGNDYPTPDGTNIRDYIHVVDIARAHVVAVERLLKGGEKENFEVFNLGTGKGSSVLEVIKAFEKISEKPLNYKIVGRRLGDVVAAYADTKKANQELGWQAQYNLEQAIADAWRWEKKIRNL